MYSIVFAGIVKDDTPNTLQDLELVFGKVLTAAIPAAGIILFVVLLLAAVNYISAGSDPKKAESARNMITYAIGGIVLVALAFLIIQVIGLFTGVTIIRNFLIFQP